MKKIKFTCPHCEAKLRVPTHLAGVSAPCPKCGSTITAPTDIAAAVLDSPVVRRSSPSSTQSPTPSRPARVEAGSRPSSAATALLDSPDASPELSEPPRETVRARSLPAPTPAAASLVATPPPPPVENRHTERDHTSLSEELSVEASPLAPEPAPPAFAPVPADPAFFTPPPPVLPEEPIIEETIVDERSEAPRPYREDAQVVIEEHFYTDAPPPPPPLSITQPIRVTSAPASDLPLARGPVAGVGTLPRLDVSLGGAARNDVEVPSLTENPGPASRTRVFLRRPGEDDEASRPEDFLVPSPPVPKSSPSVPELPPLPPVDEVSPEEVDAPEAPDFEGLAQAETLRSAPRYTTIALPPEMVPISLDELEDVEESESLDDLEDLADLVYPEDEELKSGIESPPLSGGEGKGHPFPELPKQTSSLEFALPELEEVSPPSLTSPPPQSWPQTETSSVPLQNTVVVPMQDRSKKESLEEVRESPLHEGSFGKLFAQQAQERTAPPPMPTTEPAHDATDFDELFNESGKQPARKGLDKTLIVMAAAVAIVLIVGVVGVIVAVNSFGGGFNPEEDYAKTPDEAPKKMALPKVPTSSQTAASADLSMEDAPAIVDPPAISRDAAALDALAVSFDEKAVGAVNGTKGSSVIGSPGLDLIESPTTDFSSPASAPAPAADTPPSPPAAATPAPPADTPPSPATAVAPSPTEGSLPPGVNPPSGPALAAGAPASPATGGANAADPAMAKADPTYNPAESFPAPGPEDRSTLGKSHDLIDAFLRAPDVATRLKYAYNGESLRPAVEDYYKKWPYRPFGRYSLQLFQMETDTTQGGPYWVFLVSTSDDDEGFPLIVRNEGGLLKIDWEIFAEFNDRHFLRFRDGTMPPPATFRLIAERLSDYYGSDRDAFTDLADHYVYQINPPYGDLNEYAEFAFVKKDSEVGKKLSELIKLGEDPLAVVITIDQKPFAHGVKHYIITDLVTEGWFR